MAAYHTYNDSELTGLLKSGDQNAYIALYSKYWAQTYNHIYKRLKDHNQAEDITQDIFLQLWAKREHKEIENLSAYLYGAARNSVYKTIAKQAKFMPIADLLNDIESYHDGADTNLIKIEFLRAYEALINALPEGQKTIFKMRFNEDLSPEEIARALNISPKTVRNQLGKALSSLRASLTMFIVIMAMLEK